MIIQYKKIIINGLKKIQIKKIVSDDGSNIKCLGYTHAVVNIKQGEILNYLDFHKKIREIKKADKEVLGDWIGNFEEII